MQIKATIRYHFTLVKMAIINESKSTNVAKDVEKWYLHVLLMEMQINAVTVESKWFPQKF